MHPSSKSSPIPTYVSLSFRQTPDFESPHDANLDNRYDFNFTVTDGGNSAVSYPIQITVLDGAEPPYFDYPSGSTVTTPSPTGARRCFSSKRSTNLRAPTGVVFDANAPTLTGVPLFLGLPIRIPTDRVGTTLILTLTRAPVRFRSQVLDFENLPNQMNGIPEHYSTFYGTPLTPYEINSTFVIEVNATDDVANPDQIRHFVFLTITNAVEPPIFTHGATRSVDWNETSTPGLNGFDANFTFTEDNNSTWFWKFPAEPTKIFSISTPRPGSQLFDAARLRKPRQLADSDNVYEVQLRIVGTTIVQDLNVTVRDENDAPVITNIKLTQLTIPENQAFVVDLAITDQDTGPEYKDILYSLNSNSTRYVGHTGVESCPFLPLSLGSGMVDNELPNATLSVSGDFDKDGDMDGFPSKNLPTTYTSTKTMLRVPVSFPGNRY